MKIFHSIFITIAILLAPGDAIVSAQEQEKTFGELKIEGSHIESVVLRSLDNHHTETFEPPFEAKKVPVGKYRLQNIRLDGGYYCGTKNHITVSVEENETAIFKVGAPLKSTIDLKRQGRILELRYKLIGMAGEDYPAPTRNNPPGFTVFKSDRKIASGKFEYG
ncbi:MAG: hypothetical protein JW715_10785 [Sedimentisphaerales bacterium]|nr:hypothetical protein [Sedimentisphaerales bacterium]